MSANDQELKNTTYEIFIGILSLVSIVNIVLLFIAASDEVSSVIQIMDIVLTLIFLADFAYRLSTAPNRRHYFFRQYGWADLLASMPLPQFKILRIFRVARAYRLSSEYGVNSMLRTFWLERAQSALLVVFLMILLLLEFGSLAMVYAEQDAEGANITTGSDGVWWSFVTMTTVGYGDQFPVTSMGRIIGVFVLASGVALFGTLTGYLANLFLAPPEDEADEAATAPGSAKALLAETRRELAEQERITARLRSRLQEIEQLL